MKYGEIANASGRYRKARAELLEAEIALRDQRERVAGLRRGLPLDTVVEDYLFREGPGDIGKDGPARDVPLSGLFEDPAKPLIVYQLMYGGAQKKPCPMCTMWIDGFNGIARHLLQQVNFAVAARAPIGELRHLARGRGWTNLRFISSSESSFKSDLRFEDVEGHQFPGLSVFTLGDDGSPRHFTSACAIMKEGEYRGLDLYTPVWSLLDLLPRGRGDWMPSVDYAG